MSRTRIRTDVDFQKDGKQTGFLRLPHSVHRSAYGHIPIPIVSVRNGQGPRVLLMSGNHGDEYEGQVTLIKLARTLRPEEVRGHVIILPGANFPAVLAGTRTSPIDEGNLNRSFPGDPNGSVTEMIAHYIEHELLPGSDLVVDMHSGGSSLMYMACCLMRLTGDDERTARTLEIMRAFGSPIGYVVDSRGEDRTLTAAAERQGVLAMGTELGGGGTVTPRILAVAEQGVRRVLRTVGVLPRDETPPPAEPTRLMTVGGEDYYVYSPDDGIFEPCVDLGQTVQAGDMAGAVHFPQTPWREPETSRFGRGGLVICKRFPGPTRRGDCLFHLATDYAP